MSRGSPGGGSGAPKSSERGARRRPAPPARPPAPPRGAGAGPGAVGGPASAAPLVLLREARLQLSGFDTDAGGAGAGDSRTSLKRLHAHR